MDWLWAIASPSVTISDRKNSSNIYAARDNNIAATRVEQPARLMRPPLELLLLKSSKIIPESSVPILYSHIPETERDDPYFLAFATHIDGWSIKTLCERIGKYSPVILLLKTLNTETIIGSFIRTALGPPCQEFKGDGTSFVFRLSGEKDSVFYHCPQIERPEVQEVQEKIEKQNSQENLEALPQESLPPPLPPSSPAPMLIGTATEYAFLSREYVAFGGSEGCGTNAIRIFDDLSSASSGPSDTYQNKDSLAPLEDKISFKISEIEIYCGGRRITVDDDLNISNDGTFLL
jgi:hypothetical protein